ncbi:MAG: hypothetical protein J6A77_14050 [Lachnospiraceae bacterium]|nr:hypothetical protein [Lachnospiraceae bacterium]
MVNKFLDTLYAKRKEILIGILVSLVFAFFYGWFVTGLVFGEFLILYGESLIGGLMMSVIMYGFFGFWLKVSGTNRWNNATYVMMISFFMLGTILYFFNDIINKNFSGAQVVTPMMTYALILIRRYSAFSVYWKEKQPGDPGENTVEPKESGLSGLDRIIKSLAKVLGPVVLVYMPAVVVYDFLVLQSQQGAERIVMMVTALVVCPLCWFGIPWLCRKLVKEENKTLTKWMALFLLLPAVVDSITTWMYHPAGSVFLYSNLIVVCVVYSILRGVAKSL